MTQRRVFRFNLVRGLGGGVLMKISVLLEFEQRVMELIM